MVTKATRDDVWRRVFDAERLHKYYSRELARVQGRRTKLRNTAAVAAGIGTVLGILGLVLTSSWLAMIAAVGAAVASMTVVYEDRSNLTHHYLLLSEVNAAGLDFISRTNALWSETTKPETSDGEIRASLLALEERGRELYRRINDAGLAQDERLIKSTAEATKTMLEQRYAKQAG